VKSGMKYLINPFVSSILEGAGKAIRSSQLTLTPTIMDATFTCFDAQHQHIAMPYMRLEEAYLSC
jgi:hypothetical protein